ncbi:hypothetical protein Dimus_021962 [Dionaea muscipula]
MVQGDIWKLFSRFRVVKDVFFPKKLNKAGRRFCLVRYDCPVAAEVSIKKTNGLWIKDKELRTKPIMRKDRLSRIGVSYADMVKQGEPLEANDNLTVRRLGGKKILITFCHEEEMKSFIDNHISKSSSWFSSVAPWSGEVLQINDDTAKCARCDVGKVKVLTHNMSVINQSMRLLVGGLPFVIKIAEEQDVFICNSDFSCMCICHEKEDEQTPLSRTPREDDDVAGGSNYIVSRSGELNSISFITETQEEDGVSRDGDRSIGVSGNEELGRHSSGIHVLREVVHIRDHEREANSLVDGAGGDVRHFHSRLTLQEIGPVSPEPKRVSFGPILNLDGINLEVVLDPWVILKSYTNEHIRVIEGNQICNPNNESLDFSGKGIREKVIQTARNSEISVSRKFAGLRSTGYSTRVSTSVNLEEV